MLITTTKTKQNNVNMKWAGLTLNLELTHRHHVFPRQWNTTQADSSIHCHLGLFVPLTNLMAKKKDNLLFVDNERHRLHNMYWSILQHLDSYLNTLLRCTYLVWQCILYSFKAALFPHTQLCLGLMESLLITSYDSITYHNQGCALAKFSGRPSGA